MNHQIDIHGHCVTCGQAWPCIAELLKREILAVRPSHVTA